MSKKALDTLTETMFYVLMAFSRQDMCGTEIAGYVKDITGGRVSMGPGTLYTILSNFQKAYICRHSLAQISRMAALRALLCRSIHNLQYRS